MDRPYVVKNKKKKSNIGANIRSSSIYIYIYIVKLQRRLFGDYSKIRERGGPSLVSVCPSVDNNIQQKQSIGRAACDKPPIKRPLYATNAEIRLSLSLYHQEDPAICVAQDHIKHNIIPGRSRRC